MGGQSPFIGLLCTIFNKVKPFMAMVSLQFGYAGMYIVTMLCLRRGMSHYVLAVYRHAAATLAIAPFALFFERPVLDQNLYYVGMKSTSATFSSAIFNVLPGITFIMAIIFRLEHVKIKKIHSQAKIIGTIVTFAGAMAMTLYKGPILNLGLSRGGAHHEASSSAAGQHWVAGTLMLLASCTGWSCFFILQSFTLKQYPAELSLTSLICFMGMVQGAAVALVMERKPGAWSLGWDSRLLAAVYSGVVCSGITYYVQGIVIKERGPVFVTAFNPLCMVIVAALGSLILAEQIHLGSVIGAIVIVIGLYSVVWGKSKDIVASSQLTNEKGQALELPVAATDGAKSINGDHNGSSVMEEISTKIPVAQK
uniref:WAT1-related protein n=1 Tax=Nelumbo nucifera TaxID=4432 RepID=A0A822Z7G3_NELNU|nr:TPA_asm: hypothetical protein HUJ06_013944 [Nelumbo nucifera]